MQRNCTRCGEDKSVDDFAKSNKVSSGYQNYCKVCSNQHTRAWRKANPSVLKISQHKTKQNLRTRYGQLLGNARRRKIEVNLSFEDFKTIVSPSCFYCAGSLPVTGAGIDRINCDKGYSLDNCIACCTDCNLTRNRLWSFDEFNKYIAPAIRQIKYERRTRSR